MSPIGKSKSPTSRKDHLSRNVAAGKLDHSPAAGANSGKGKGSSISYDNSKSRIATAVLNKTPNAKITTTVLSQTQ
jgi:hypothetical protein